MKKIYLLMSIILAISGIMSAQTLIVEDEDMTIDSPAEYEEIVIYNATLTIRNTTVSIGYRIRVVQTGKLIVDNSTLTKVDGRETWTGIDMEGDFYNTIPDFRRSEVEIKNGSTIEYALLGVDLNWDGKLTVSGDETTFRYNRYGIHLRLSSDSNTEISIKDATFSENDIGIEMHRQNESIEIDNCKFLNNSEIDIYFNKDIPESLISVNNCKFEGGSKNIYCKELYDLKIENCEFDKSYCAIYSKSSTGLEIVGNTFGNYSSYTQNYGVKLINSDCEIKDDNKFFPWHGIVALSDQPGIGCVKITDGNYFNSYIYDINISGMDSYEKSKISGNFFNDCKDAISIEGSNNYIVRDNTFEKSDNPIFASATGYYQNQIL